MRKKRTNLLWISIILVVSMSFNSMAALNSSFYENAQEKTLCVNSVVSDISPSSIDIGEEFTVGIQIESCGDEVPENVSFEIIGIPDDISVKEPLKTTISRFYYSNSERFLLYHMKVSKEAKPGTHIIKTRLYYGNGAMDLYKDDSISIDVIGNEADLDVASVKTKPVIPFVGDTVELTIRIENFGDGSANSVRVYADHPFKGIKESFMGTLDSNEDGPVIFTFITDQVGEFSFPVKISYKDDFGVKEIETNVSVIVLEKETNWRGIIITSASGLVFLLLLFYFYRSRKQKNKIIQQLLKGNGSNGHDNGERKPLKKAKK